MLAKFTTRPLAILTSGRKVLVISITPHRFTSAVRLNILIGAQSIGSMYPIPALFTSPHSPPAQEEILNDCIIQKADGLYGTKGGQSVFFKSQKIVGW